MTKSSDMRALALTLLMMVSTALYAQVTVSGVVTETTGDPVIGCTVREKGTTTGTITDIDGNYSIRVSSANATLLFTYVGMEDQEVKIAGRKTVNASVTMDESKMKGSIITSLDQSLQGRAAGVQATQTSGAPGSSSSIRVRGTATINANAEPLYVIDGVIVQSQGSSGASYERRLGHRHLRCTGCQRRGAHHHQARTGGRRQVQLRRHGGMEPPDQTPRHDEPARVCTILQRPCGPGRMLGQRTVQRPLAARPGHQLAGRRLPDRIAAPASGERTGRQRQGEILRLGRIHGPGRYHHRLGVRTFLPSPASPSTTSTATIRASARKAIPTPTPSPWR